MANLQFHTQFAHNALIIIDGLRSDELQTASHLYEELMDFQFAQNEIKALIQPEKVTTRQELLDLLDAIAVSCAEGLRPILHFECHGNKERGLQIGDGREWISWDDLHSRLLGINIISGNNTGVVMAACEGFYALKPLSVHEPCPFWFMIGPQLEVRAGVLRDKMKEFYKTLYRTADLDRAMAELDSRFKRFMADRFFAIMWGRILKRYGEGKGLRVRRERLVGTVLDGMRASGKIPDVKAVRSYIKRATLQHQEKFDAYAAIFLHGKPGATFQQVYDWVNSGCGRK